MVNIEIQSITDDERLRRIIMLLPEDHDTINLTDSIFDRAKVLEGKGFKAADAVHIAAAEAGCVDVLLTCDDRMFKCAQRDAKHLRVRIQNPIDWLSEQTDENDIG